MAKRKLQRNRIKKKVRSKRKNNHFKTAVRRDHKARIFEMIYHDPVELLRLYNAVNDTNYDNPDELEINTLENAIYLSMHNDVSFIIDSRLSLYEHQSTYNPNLPLRYLMYVSDLYSKITRGINLYGSKKILIPSPKFLIFYNGSESRPEREEMKLSDAFEIEDPDPSLELKAIMLNINPGNNEVLLNACKTLKDYVEYTSRVRRYAEEIPIEDAVEKAITECIAEDILADFLMKSRAEAKKMSIYEYDEERQRRFDREEGKYEAILGMAEICKEMGLSLEEAVEKIARKCKEDPKKVRKEVQDIWKVCKGMEDKQNRLDVEEGMKIGMQNGLDSFAKLTKILLEEDRLDELKRASENREFRENLLKELGI